MPPSERIKRGMQHAGPSITITSLTDCMAFFIGSTSSMLAIKSFCIFCGVTVIMLYLTVITIFLCVVVWDTHRVAHRGKECCGFCYCGEDSYMFCSGRFLTPNQRKYSNLEPTVVEKAIPTLPSPSMKSTIAKDGKTIEFSPSINNEKSFNKGDY